MHHFDCKGLKTNSGLSVDSVTKLLDYNLNAEYFNVNASNQLSPVFELQVDTASGNEGTFPFFVCPVIICHVAPW